MAALKDKASSRLPCRSLPTSTPSPGGASDVSVVIHGRVQLHREYSQRGAPGYGKLARSMSEEIHNPPGAIRSPLVAVVMGSQSDWQTMRAAHEILEQFGIAHECDIVSAHRTPQKLADFSAEAEARGLEVIIAGAGGAAHLPGMIAAQTPVPVLGVPVQSRALSGMDSLLSIAQMPGGVPVGTLAIGEAGAKNAALLAIAILSNSRPELRAKLNEFRAQQTQKVLDTKLEN